MWDRPAVRLLVVLALLASGGLVRQTYAAFGATTANPSNTFTAAASFCPNPGAQTLTATADAYVDQTLAASNFGTESTLEVRSFTAANRRAFVTFALPSIDPDCTLVSASLRFNASSASSGRTVQARRASASWTEGGINWTNQPSATGATSTASSATGWIAFDVRTQVQSMYSGSNHGFVVRDATESSTTPQTQTYSSREGANDPELVLTLS